MTCPYSRADPSTDRDRKVVHFRPLRMSLPNNDGGAEVCALLSGETKEVQFDATSTYHIYTRIGYNVGSRLRESRNLKGMIHAT